jgi:hypothetical protein
MPAPRRLAREGLARLAERLYDRTLRRAPRRVDEEWRSRALEYADAWDTTPAGVPSSGANPLRAFFDARTEGQGIWKWDHYFDVYHRHLERFRGSAVHILEIGIYSGGSLELWRDYFGGGCQVYGVDVEEACRSYEDDATTVFIGDQADRDFWRTFRAAVPKLDVVVDDGGHQPDQQATSLEELLPHLAPGGVYIVEDVHGVGNRFGDYAAALVDALNAYQGVADHRDPERRKVSKATSFQSAVDSIHTYPFITVIEKRRAPIAEFVAPKRGTRWAPFMS